MDQKSAKRLLAPAKLQSFHLLQILYPELKLGMRHNTAYLNACNLNHTNDKLNSLLALASDASFIDSQVDVFYKHFDTHNYFKMDIDKLSISYRVSESIVSALVSQIQNNLIPDGWSVSPLYKSDLNDTYRNVYVFKCVKKQSVVLGLGQKESKKFKRDHIRAARLELVPQYHSKKALKSFIHWFYDGMSEEYEAALSDSRVSNIEVGMQLQALAASFVNFSPKDVSENSYDKYELSTLAESNGTKGLPVVQETLARSTRRAKLYCSVSRASEIVDKQKTKHDISETLMNRYSEAAIATRFEEVLAPRAVSVREFEKIAPEFSRYYFYSPELVKAASPELKKLLINKKLNTLLTNARYEQHWDELEIILPQHRTAIADKDNKRLKQELLNRFSDLLNGY